jgi:hypothetical protein
MVCHQFLVLVVVAREDAAVLEDDNNENVCVCVSVCVCVRERERERA